MKVGISGDVAVRFIIIVDVVEVLVGRVWCGLRDVPSSPVGLLGLLGLFPPPFRASLPITRRAEIKMITKNLFIFLFVCYKFKRLALALIFYNAKTVIQIY